jgi:glycosyltransferase involved in cell wall biosynthesis
MIKVALLTTDSREHFKHYASQQPCFGTAPEALLEGFKSMPENIEVHVVSCLQKIPISSPEKLADNIYYHAIHVPNIGWMKTGYLGCSQAVRRELRKIQPDIVHGQGTERDCAISAVRSGYPNVLTIHGNMRLVAEFLQVRPLTYYWFADRLERFCLRKTNGVVAISSYTQSNIERYTSRTWLVPNAVHPSFFDVPRHPDTMHRILCLANIGPRKNQIGLIQALDSLAKSKPLRLVFGGGGSEADPYYREFTQMVSARSWCDYIGPLDRTELQTEMSRAAIGILPSFEDNCPMVVLEAAAAGLPFAASRVGGVPDLIQHNVSGLLFDPSSNTEIRAVVAMLVADGLLAESLAARALTRCKERFAADSVARQHVNIYNAVIKRP